MQTPPDSTRLASGGGSPNPAGSGGASASYATLASSSGGGGGGGGGHHNPFHSHSVIHGGVPSIASSFASEMTAAFNANNQLTGWTYPQSHGGGGYAATSPGMDSFTATGYLASPYATAGMLGHHHHHHHHGQGLLGGGHSHMQSGSAAQSFMSAEIERSNRHYVSSVAAAVGGGGGQNGGGGGGGGGGGAMGTVIGMGGSLGELRDQFNQAFASAVSAGVTNAFYPSPTGKSHGAPCMKQ